MLKDFKEFLTASNALALAIGVIIGGATGKVVSALVGDLMMPLIALVMPAGDWRQLEFVLTKATDATGKITVNSLKYGDFIGSVVDFVVIAFVVFWITRLILPKPPAPDPTKTCPECLESVPAAAKKCKACASALPA